MSTRNIQVLNVRSAYVAATPAGESREYVFEETAINCTGEQFSLIGSKHRSNKQ